MLCIAWQSRKRLDVRLPEASTADSVMAGEAVGKAGRKPGAHVPLPHHVEAVREHDVEAVLAHIEGVGVRELQSTCIHTYRAREGVRARLRAQLLSERMPCDERRPWEHRQSGQTERSGLHERGECGARRSPTWSSPAPRAGSGGWAGHYRLHCALRCCLGFFVVATARRVRHARWGARGRGVGVAWLC